MPACPYCSSSDLTRDGHDQRGRVIRACRACGRHATSESTSLMAGHRFPRDIILLAVRYYLQLGAAAERIAGIYARVDALGAAPGWRHFGATSRYRRFPARADRHAGCVSVRAALPLCDLALLGRAAVPTPGRRGSPHRMLRGPVNARSYRGMTSDALVSVRDLQVHFRVRPSFLTGRGGGWIRAVDGVRLRIGCGETLGLVGESGSGKSTLGLTILQLHRATAGSVEFDGQELTRLREEELRPI